MQYTLSMLVCCVAAPYQQHAPARPCIVYAKPNTTLLRPVVPWLLDCLSCIPFHCLQFGIKQSALDLPCDLMPASGRSIDDQIQLLHTFMQQVFKQYRFGFAQDAMVEE